MALCMSSISFSLSPHLISLSMTNLSHKCRKLRNLVPPPFPTSWTLPLLISLISKIKGFLHSMLVFHVIILVILYILVSQNIEGQRERERERESQCQKEYEIGFGFRCIWSKPLNNIVKTWYNASMLFKVLKMYVWGKHKAFICVICVYLYFWEVLNPCKWLSYSNICKIKLNDRPQTK